MSKFSEMALLEHVTNTSMLFISPQKPRHFILANHFCFKRKSRERKKLRTISRVAQFHHCNNSLYKYILSWSRRLECGSAALCSHSVKILRYFHTSLTSCNIFWESTCRGFDLYKSSSEITEISICSISLKAPLTLLKVLVGCIQNI